MSPLEQKREAPAQQPGPPGNIAHAFCRARDDFPPVPLDAQNPQARKAYTSAPALHRALRATLARHGLVVEQQIESFDIHSIETQKGKARLVTVTCRFRLLSARHPDESLEWVFAAQSAEPSYGLQSAQSICWRQWVEQAFEPETVQPDVPPRQARQQQGGRIRRGA